MTQPIEKPKRDAIVIYDGSNSDTATVRSQLAQAGLDISSFDAICLAGGGVKEIDQMAIVRSVRIYLAIHEVKDQRIVILLSEVNAVYPGDWYLQKTEAGILQTRLEVLGFTAEVVIVPQEVQPEVVL
jgi:hypothetical protein